jgi:hypothetical protein
MNKPRIQLTSQCEQLPDELRAHPPLQGTYSCVGPARIGAAVVVVHVVGAPTPGAAYATWLEARAQAHKQAPQIEQFKRQFDDASDLTDDLILRAKRLAAE